jgi:hypothetical protein
MAHLILKSLIDLCNASGVNTFSIEIKTNNDYFIIEKISEDKWSLDTDDDARDENGQLINTKFVETEHILSWFDNEHINLIKMTGEDSEHMVIYQA